MEIEIKQPMEKYPIKLDFSDRLVGGEKITTATVTARLGRLNVTRFIIDSNSFKNREVTVKLKNGFENNYKITVLIDTDDDNTYEKDVLLMVRSI